MILLTSTSDKLQVISGSAGTLHTHVDYVDLASGGTVTAGRLNTNISTATTTDVSGSPAASTTRNIKGFVVGNQHASVSQVVTVQHTDGTTVSVLESVTLAPGERIGYTEGTGMRIVDAIGAVRTPSAVQNGNSNTADITTGAGTDTYLTGGSLGYAPVIAKIQAASHFKWKIRLSKGATGTTAPSFIIRFGTAGAVGDTARVTLAATGTATAVADTAFAEIDMNFRSVGATAVAQGVMRFERTAAANTGFGGTVLQLVAATSASFDVTPSGTIIGMSLSPGTGTVATVQYVSVEANNLVT
jgi:hypothetical protein